MRIPSCALHNFFLPSHITFMTLAQLCILAVGVFTSNQDFTIVSVNSIGLIPHQITTNLSWEGM